MKNNNQKVIRRLSNRSLKQNKMRNLFVIIAISLTSLLFTAFFSLGAGTLQVTQEQTMRRVGTRGHAGLKDVTREQYEKITSHPMVKDHSYNIPIGFATNKELTKRQTEIRYTEKKDFEFGFLEFEEGRLPKQENEITLDTFVMEMLGIPAKLGAKCSLEYNFMGNIVREDFQLCGWYQGDPMSGASQVYISKAYLDKISQGFTEEDFLKEKDNLGTGLFQGTIMFGNSMNIEENINKVLLDSGYNREVIDVGINWAYFSEMSNELDLFNVLIIVIAFAVVILTGYLIIYNIFQISISADIRFYGLLKTIGTTKKQIKRLILRQAFLLSVIGIPLGLLLGFFVGNLLMPIYLKGMSGLHTSNFHLKPNLWIFLFSALFSLITIVISCRKPGKIASRVSPVEAAKYTEINTVKRKAKRTLHGARIYKMAFANLGRNKRKTILTILSLSLSVILMTEIVTFSKSFSVDRYLESMLTGDFMISSVSLTNYQADAPLLLPEDFYESMNKQEGIESCSRMYHSNASNRHTLSQSGKERFRNYYEADKLKVLEGYPYNKETIEQVINEDYPIHEERFAYSERLLNKLKVVDGVFDKEKFKSGNYVLVSSNLEENETYYAPGDKIELQFQGPESKVEEVKVENGTIVDHIWVNGIKKTYEVMAVVEIPYSMTIRRFSLNALVTILPEEELLKQDKAAECFAGSFIVEDEKEPAIQSYLEQYTTRINPNTDFESKEELREEMSSMKDLINIVGGALSFVIGIIGILNFINSMITSVMTRKREFAMLQSIGLTNRQLRRLLTFEGLYYFGLTAIVSILIGSFLSVTLIKALNQVVNYFIYQFTMTPFLALLPVFLLIGLFVPNIAYRQAKKQSIVVRLRESE